MRYQRSFSSLVMRFNFQLTVAGFVTCVAVTGATAQTSGPYIYPSKGQTQEQENRDKYECQQWAVSQSGFDPSKPSATSTSPQQPQGQAAHGAARGAAVGAVGGAMAGEEVGARAAGGAARGGLVGMIRRRREKKEAEQEQAQAQAAGANGQDAYNRAFASCLQGRGYAVN